MPPAVVALNVPVTAVFCVVTHVPLEATGGLSRMVTACTASVTGVILVADRAVTVTVFVALSATEEPGVTSSCSKAVPFGGR